MGWLGIRVQIATEHLGLPLLHISFKYRSNRRPVVAKGLIAIGQFACGVRPLSQFGEGCVSVSQFTIAGYAFAQFDRLFPDRSNGKLNPRRPRQIVKSVDELLKLIVG